MWFAYSMLTALLWGGADLFYKKGNGSGDKYSHLKTSVAVGFVMGIHALIYALTSGVAVAPMAVIKYLPVSFFYILSMTLGYKGLRYLELSVISPVQNSSGAVTTILLLLFLSYSPKNTEIAGILLILTGTILLAVFEGKAAPASTIGEKKYKTGAGAFIYPIAYCLLDGAGTFLDGLYLDEYGWISEDEALIAYELTFFICGLAGLIYLLIKGERPEKKDGNKAAAAVLETAGQYFYVFAMSGRSLTAAPLVSSYCVFSVIFSRVFIKEKLTKKQYAAIVAVLIGIILLALGES